MSEPVTAALAAGAGAAIAALAELIRSRTKKPITEQDVKAIEGGLDEIRRSFEALKTELRMEHNLMKREVADKLDDLVESFDQIIGEQNRVAAKFPLLSDAIHQLRDDVREIRTGRHLRIPTLPPGTGLDDGEEKP